MKEAKYSPAEMPELVKLIVKAIGRYLCSRACDYAGAEGTAHYIMDTKDLSDIFMIDEPWLEAHKPDIYNAAWHDPLFLKYIKHGSEFTKAGLFALDVKATTDDEYLSDMSDNVYERMETFLDIWCKMVVKGSKIDLVKLRNNYNGGDLEDDERLRMLRYDLECALLARKILLMAAEESNQDGQAAFDIDSISLPWTDFHTRVFDVPELIEQFVPGKESEVARCMREDVFLSKYLLMYEIWDFDEEHRTGWLDIQIGTDLALWDDGKIEEGEADCRYHDAMENYRRATKSCELLDWHGTYEELLAIYEYLNTPSEMVYNFNRLDRETRRKKYRSETGWHTWPNDVVTELKKGTEGTDPVNHPTHYADSCSLECIDVMQTMFDDEQFGGYLLCNAFKYLWRHKNKGGKEDLRKAKWYLDKFEEDCISYSERLVVTYQRLRFLFYKIVRESDK